MIELRDKWGQPIAVVAPTSGGGASVPQSYAEPASETPSAGSTPPAQDFGAEADVPHPPQDEAVDKINQFEQWLQTCANQREMAKGFPTWAAWSREMAKNGDQRFTTAGELAIRMKESWARRKAQVPA